MKDLTAGFKVAGSQAAQMGLEVEETNAAIGTMVAVTRQGGNIAGRALKGILMNIQQVKGVVDEETGDFIDEESLSKAAKALDSVGVATKEYRDGVLELRDPMMILDELAAKWNDLSTVQQSTLVEGIAGKYRSNQFIALMSNWDLYNKMLTDQVDATGSAADEVAIYLDSWEGRTEKLTNTWVEFVSKTVEAESIKGLISLLTDVIDVLDNLGNVILVTAGALIFFKREAIAGTIIELGKLRLATIGTTGALGLLTMALGVGFMAYSQYNEAQAAARQEAIDLGKTTRDELNSIQSLSDKYTELSQKVTKTDQDKRTLASIQDALVSKYGVEKNSIDLLNGSYADNIILIQKATEAKRIAAAKEMEIEAAKAQKYISTSKTNLNLKKLGIDYYGMSSMTPTEQRVAIKRKIDEMKAITPAGKMGKEQLAVVSNLEKWYNDLDSTIQSNMEVIYTYNALMSGDFSRFGLGGEISTGGTAESVINPYEGGGGSSAEDSLKKIKDALDDYIKSLEHELYLMEQRKESEEDRVAFMRKIQEAIHNQANYYRSLNLAETSSEIQSLQKMWWQYENSIATIRLDAMKKQAADMESVASYVADRYNQRIKDLQESRRLEEESWNAQIEAIRSTNEALEDNIALQEAQEALARAKSNKVRVYREGQGFVYEEDVTAVSEARKNLDKLNREQQLKDEVARLEKLKKQALDNIDTQIKRWEDYSKSWSEVASNYKKDQDKLLAEQVFGINTEKAGWEERLGNAQAFVAQYNALMAQIGAASGAALGGGAVQTGSNTVKVGSSGVAPAGLSVGTIVQTAGGDYKITGTGNPNSASGYYSQKLAVGTTNASAGMANVDEHGSELILRNPPSGRMTYMEKGDGVVPANLTKNLMEWGKFNPSSFTPNATGGGSSIVYQIDNLTLPSVRNAEDLINGLQTLKTRAMQKSKSRE